MYIKQIVAGLDDCSTGLKIREVVDKVFAVYKEISKSDSCTAETVLNDTTKVHMLSILSDYYHTDLSNANANTCAELANAILSSDGETLADMVNKSWDSSEMLAPSAHLQAIATSSRVQYSTEGFLGEIADAILSIANTFKTNVFKFTKALKRSEMRIFVDGNLFLCKDVDGRSYMDVMEKTVDVPTGMITTYANSVEYIKAVYDQLDALSYGKDVLRSLNDFRYRLCNNNFHGTIDFPAARAIAAKEKVLKWAALTQLKCYKDKGAATKVKFKDAYISMEEFASIRGALIDMEHNLQDVDKLVDTIDDISETLGDITSYVKDADIPKKMISELADITRIVGACFDLYGQTAMRQMALEHNHIMNYINLYKTR